MEKKRKQKKKERKKISNLISKPIFFSFWFSYCLALDAGAAMQVSPIYGWRIEKGAPARQKLPGSHRKKEVQESNAIKLFINPRFTFELHMEGCDPELMIAP